MKSTNQKWKVTFTDNPWDSAVMSGTKAEVMKQALLYIRQWNLDATVHEIVPMSEEEYVARAQKQK